MFSIKTFAITTAIAVAGLFSSADAGIININFNGVLSGAYGTDAGELLAPAPYTGTTWNGSGTGGTTVTLNNMTYSDGTASTVDLTMAGAKTASSTAADNPFMDALSTFRFDSSTSTPTTFVLNGLTQGLAYDIHFILQGNANEGGTVTMTAGADVLPAAAESLGNFGRGAAQGGPADSYIQGRNYATQSFVANGTSASFDLTGNTAKSGLMLIAGAQIVEVPEPASLALLGLGGLMIVRRK